MCRSRLLSTLVLLLIAAAARAETRMPAIFSDNMVLQQGIEAPVWGWAEPGRKITVTFAGQTRQAVADDKGNWKVAIGPLAASSQPGELVVSAGDDTLKFSNVLVGEVWIASGQSNMAMSVARSNNSAKEIADAGNHADIRLFTARRLAAGEPKTDTTGAWVVCGPETAARFSAVAYFFGRELAGRLKTPVGLVHSSWGGTRIEAWTPRPTLEKIPAVKENLASWDERIKQYDPEAAQEEYKKKLAEWKLAAQKAKADKKRAPRKPYLSDPRRSPHRPAGLYNGMIAPLIPYAIRGVIWYQGESNARGAPAYRTLFPAMINDWRANWGQGEFPFLFVLLANYRAVQTAPSQPGRNWALLREAQLTALSLPKTGMASAIDVGDAKNIHPKNKQDVGRRLALAARAIAYGEKLVYSGPIYKSMRRDGGKIVLSFDHVGGGLTARGEKGLKGFAIAGKDKKFVWAEAKIDGDKVTVWAEQVAEPAAVRYGWADNPIGNLYNKEALPASPFRTDDWEK